VSASLRVDDPLAPVPRIARRRVHKAQAACSWGLVVVWNRSKRPAGSLRLSATFRLRGAPPVARTPRRLEQADVACGDLLRLVARTERHEGCGEAPDARHDQARVAAFGRGKERAEVPPRGGRGHPQEQGWARDSNECVVRAAGSDPAFPWERPTASSRRVWVFSEVSRSLPG